jgi:hypothetical protein
MKLRFYRIIKRKMIPVKIVFYARKILYVVTLVLLVGWLLERSYCIFQEYLSNPTFTETVILPQYQADVPALTVCPQYNGYKKDILKVLD